MNELQCEALKVLAEIWTLAPEVRLGQLMAHLGFLGEVHVGKSLGYIDDDELIAILYRHRTELRSRLAGTGNPSIPSCGDASSVSGSSILQETTPAVEL